MKQQTFLTILQQSEYDWPQFLAWYQAHQTSIPELKPQKWTLKLKLINLLTKIFFFLPLLLRLKLAWWLVKLLELPVKYLIILSAKIKLAYLKKRGLTVVAFAGSFAKTSTKQLATQLLNQDLRVIQTEKSYNTPLGISQTIHKKLSTMTDLFLVELGEYYAGDIQHLSQFVKPDYGIMTPLGQQHLERMGSLKKIALTIGELAQYFKQAPAKVLIHQSYRPYLAEQAKLGSKFYGQQTDNHYRLIEAQVSRAGTEYQLKLDQLEISGFTPLLGRHQIINLLPSFWLAKQLKLDLKKINQKTASLEHITRRHQPKFLNQNILLIDNSYNTNPTSIKASLDLLDSLEAERKIIITAGFVELGQKTAQFHAQLGKELAKKVDYLGLIKSRWNQALSDGFLEAGGKQEQIITAQNPTEALDKLRDKITKNSLILIEGGYQEIFA